MGAAGGADRPASASSPATTITGWAFTQHGGTVFWDKAGLDTQMPQSGGTYDTLTAWVRAQRATKGAGLPPDIAAIVKLDRDKRTPEQAKQLRDYFVQNGWSKTQAAARPAARRASPPWRPSAPKLDAGDPGDLRLPRDADAACRRTS